MLAEMSFPQAQATAKEIYSHHYKLNETIENTGEFIKKIVTEHENDFLAAFE